MKKKVVLITGASRGLGKALAKKLSEKYIVYSGVRDLSQASQNTLPVHLDFTKEKTFPKAVGKIIKDHKKIDILIHNAGIAYLGPVDSMTLEEAYHQFQVNFFGPFSLTQQVLPYMRTQKSGRILFVSSVRAVDSGAYIGLYAASKAALEAIAFDWAVTLARWNIVVSIVQPGPINTGIQFKQGTQFLNNPYPSIGALSLELQSVEEVCEAILKQLEETDPPFKYQTNETTKKIVSNHLQDYSGKNWLKEQKKWFFKNIHQSTKE